MKNIRIVQLMLITTLFLTVSCNEDIESSLVEEQIVQENQDLNQEITYNVLDWTPTVYHDFFKATENVAGYNSLKSPLQVSSIVQAQSLSDVASKGGGVIISSKKVSIANKSEKLSNAKGQQLFGEHITFTVNSASGKSFKDGSTSKEVSMYVPKQLEISNPPITNEDEIVPYCFSDNFVLEWNADPDNKEGLVVVAEYNGLTAIPSNNRKPVTNTLNITNDNGRIVLRNELWKDIPNTAIVNLSVLRGNVKIEEIDEENYKFYALAQAITPIVLIKDVNTFQK